MVCNKYLRASTAPDATHSSHAHRRCTWRSYTECCDNSKPCPRTEFTTCSRSSGAWWILFLHSLLLLLLWFSNNWINLLLSLSLSLLCIRKEQYFEGVFAYCHMNPWRYLQIMQTTRFSSIPDAINHSIKSRYELMLRTCCAAAYIPDSVRVCISKHFHLSCEKRSHLHKPLVWTGISKQPRRLQWTRV